MRAMKFKIELLFDFGLGFFFVAVCIKSNGSSNKKVVLLFESTSKIKLADPCWKVLGRFREVLEVQNTG